MPGVSMGVSGISGREYHEDREVILPCIPIFHVWGFLGFSFARAFCHAFRVPSSASPSLLGRPDGISISSFAPHRWQKVDLRF